MMEIANNLRTDVLVIGAGGAGVRAALEARQSGAQVILATKGKLGKSGTTAFEVAEIAGYNVADGCGDYSDSTTVHYQDIMNAALGTCNPLLARILAEEAPGSLKELEQWGVSFEKKDEHHLAVEGCFASKPRMHIIKGHSKPILDALIPLLLDAGVIVLQETMIIDLVVADNSCQGALAIDIQGKYLQIDALAVILTTGGAGQLFTRNMNPPDVTGDGYALALRAGADLMNMEFMQMGLGLVYPFVNILNCWVWYLHPKLLNGKMEEFLPRYLPSGIDPISCMNDKAHHFPFSARDLSKYIEVGITKEINQGGATEHGGIYLDFRRIDLSRVSGDFRRMWQTTKQWLNSRGIDPDHHLLEVAPFGHAINGGLNVGELGESNIKNLFAAGEVAGGPHGADRLGGNMIVGCQVFGKRVGKAAALAASLPKYHSKTRTDFDQIPWLEKNGTLDPEYVKAKIQALMSAHFLIVRNEPGLNHIIHEMQQLTDQINDQGFKIANPNQKISALECRNLIDLAKVMAGSALLRTESRGSHYREDYPTTIPEWECSVVCHIKKGFLNYKRISWGGGV